jgi:hypothetical protein
MLAAIRLSASTACRLAVAGLVSRPNSARMPSPTNWFGCPPACSIALDTAVTKRLMMNIVSNGRRFSAIRVDPRMSTNMLTM